MPDLRDIQSRPPLSLSNGGTELKYSEFRRWLEQQGAMFIPGKGSHFHVTLNGKTAMFPYHGSKEIGTGLVRKIKKDLNLK